MSISWLRVPLTGIVLAALACTFGRAAPAPTAVSGPVGASPTPAEARPPATEARPATPSAAAPTVAASATSPAPEASATPALAEQPLSASGPWLVLWGQTGAYAVNADGSGLTRVLADWPYLRPGPAAPEGGLVAFTGSDDPLGERGLALYTLEVATGTVTEVTLLASAGTEPGPGAEPGDPAYQIAWVLGQSAWSPPGAPGGLGLAFIGAQGDSLSADLYLYSPAANRRDRLTDGPSQAYQPEWSPDGQYIVQMGADSFGTGAGYAMAGAWAARADNTQVIPLYTPNSGDEIVLGWIGPSTFVVESFYSRCSVGQLRAVDINPVQVTPMFAGFYSGAALDPATATALVAVDEFVASCNALEPAGTPGAEPGLYLARPGAEPRRVEEVEADAVTWLEGAGLFVARLGDQVRAYTPQGQPAALPEAMTAYWEIATAGRPGGVAWAWPGPDRFGLLASLEGQPTVTVSDEAGYKPTWSPNGHTLLFYGGDTFYAAELPGLSPAPVAGPAELQGRLEYTWVP